MNFYFSHSPRLETLAADLQRVVEFLAAHGAESVTNLKISCYPWRNGKRLQAVNSEGEIGTIGFDYEPGDERYEPNHFQEERDALIIRERPDELGDIGFATWFNHDD